MATGPPDLTEPTAANRGRWRGAPWAAWVLGSALVAVVTVFVSWRYTGAQHLVPMIDLDVYERAGRAVLRGDFAYVDGGSGLPFTYPPFAALVAVLTAGAGFRSGQVFWTVATVGALTTTVALSFRALFDRVAVARRPVLLGALSAAAVVSVPVSDHIGFGQVNVFLVLLCTADLLVEHPRWPRGVLIGLATACKLTPGVFIVTLVLAGRRREATRAVLTFAACEALAFAVLPGPSVDYWTSVMFDTGRVTGSLGYTSNQSILGVLSRTLPATWASPLWWAAVAVVAVVGFGRARAAGRAGDLFGMVGTTAALAVVLSPIAWIHHLVWLVPAMGALVGDGRDRARVWCATALLILFVLPLPTWGWQLLGDHGAARVVGVLAHNGYALIAMLLALSLPIASDPRARAGPDQAPPTSYASTR